jgi:very-short-patch-repair endonuclease
LLQRQRVGDKPLESTLEVKTWRLVRAANLPLPERQVPIEPYRVDMLWRAPRVVLECDGFEAHAGYLRWKRDRRRVGAIEAAGYRMLHVTWDDVTSRPREVVRRCLVALGRA